MPCSLQATSWRSQRKICSPQRKLWVKCHHRTGAPVGAEPQSSRCSCYVPDGTLTNLLTATHGSRRGLQFFRRYAAGILKETEPARFTE